MKFHLPFCACEALRLNFRTNIVISPICTLIYEIPYSLYGVTFIRYIKHLYNSYHLKSSVLLWLFHSKSLTQKIIFCLFCDSFVLLQTPCAKQFFSNSAMGSWINDFIVFCNTCCINPLIWLCIISRKAKKPILVWEFWVRGK